jgi:probable rRNA maturation factor
MTFYVENEVEAKFDFDIEKLAESVAKAVLKAEKCKYDVEISLTITDDAGIQEINKEFRNIDKPTDVLSFPTISYEEPGDFSVIELEQKNDVYDPDTGNISFGDIVINEARVRSQAKEYGHSEKREFAFLVAHSMLHLCGYDHMEEEEAKIMEAKQESVLQSLGITRD